MAIVAIAADVHTCPRCLQPLGPAQRGRRTGKWLRRCATPTCPTSTVSIDAPVGAVIPATHPIVCRYENELPLSLGVPAIVADAIDARMRAAGDREPGEDD